MNRLGELFINIGRGIKKGFFGLITWIKETAWVQPLLIVGAIFGLILSIKPVVSWVSGLFTPTEAYDFYVTHTVSDMEKLESDYIDSTNGDKYTIMVVFYAHSDSTSADVEKIVKNFTSNKYFDKQVVWYCVDADDEDPNAVKHKENQDAINDTFQEVFLDTYNAVFKTMPNGLKTTSADDLTFCDDDTTNTKIPTPLICRYNYVNSEVKYECDGVHTGAISADDLQLFVEGNAKEWNQGYLEIKA